MEVKSDEQYSENIDNNNIITAQVQVEDGNNDYHTNNEDKLNYNDDLTDKKNEINNDTNGNNITLNNNTINNYEAEDDEVVFVNTEKINSSNISIVEDKLNKENNLNNANKVKEKEKEKEKDSVYESVDLTNLSKFDALKSIIEKQNKILSMTEASKEKLSLFEDMAKDQLLFFQHSTKKYGNYLKLVKSELFTIQDLIRKIKKEVDKK